MKDIFGPVPLPIIALLLLAGVGIVILLSVPSAWVFPFLRFFGFHVGDTPDRDKRPKPPNASG